MLMLDSIQQRVLNVSMRFWLNELTAIFMYVPTPLPVPQPYWQRIKHPQTNKLTKKIKEKS